MARLVIVNKHHIARCYNKVEPFAQYIHVFLGLNESTQVGGTLRTLVSWIWYTLWTSNDCWRRNYLPERTIISLLYLAYGPYQQDSPLQLMCAYPYPDFMSLFHFDHVSTVLPNRLSCPDIYSRWVRKNHFLLTSTNLSPISYLLVLPTFQLPFSV